MHTDVTGQPGGPHPDEQARVDEEQIELIAKIKAQRTVENAEERATHQAKLDRAAAVVQKRVDLESLVIQLAARVEALEARVM